MQVEHEPNEKPAAKVDWLTIFSNLAAAAIVLPAGWYLNHHYHGVFAGWLRGMFQ